MKITQEPQVSPARVLDRKISSLVTAFLSCLSYHKEYDPMGII